MPIRLRNFFTVSLNHLSCGHPQAATLKKKYPQQILSFHNKTSAIVEDEISSLRSIA